MFLRIIVTLVLLQVFVATSGADEVWGSRASWDHNISTHFWDLPKNLTAAKEEGWTRVSGVDPPKGVTPLGFSGDPAFVLLFHKNVVIGYQLAFLVSDVENSGQRLDYDALDWVIKKRLNGDLYYTATVFVRRDELDYAVLGVRFQKKNGFFEIPMNASLVPSETDWIKKNCVPTMGTHYYTWNSTSDCTKLNPWFLLELDGYIKGVGFQGFGNLTSTGPRTWWEVIPDGGLEVVMSDAPACALEGVEEFGAISLHVWFVDDPQHISCS